MHEHHRQTILRLADSYERDPGYLALVVVGSVARGEAGARSDVDFVLLATDEEYARRHPMISCAMPMLSPTTQEGTRGDTCLISDTSVTPWNALTSQRVSSS